ncbi:DUF5615 family PIN-like protein [Lunatimonas salinarum]|uniref:DUF5615 family PIN-like protein n=1 Tax=Lunatimonas salinarum TaxID=1774590 RepID=UPI003CC91A95
MHINEILEGSSTKDKDICEFADAQDLIVITKDADFRNSYLINNTPKKLVRIKLGNLANSTLIKVISENLNFIKRLNSQGSFMIELDQVSSKFIIK